MLGRINGSFLQHRAFSFLMQVCNSKTSGQYFLKIDHHHVGPVFPYIGMALVLAIASAGHPSRRLQNGNSAEKNKS